MRRMDKRQADDAAALDAILAEARGPAPDAALLARIVADAASVAAGRARPAPRVVRRPGWGRRLAEALGGLAEPLGGWRGATALAACAVAGFWLGIAGPDPVLQMADAGIGTPVGLSLIGAEDLLAGVSLPPEV
jgi:hypothetical protein